MRRGRRFPWQLSLLWLSLACGGGFDMSQYPTPEALLAASVQEFNDGDCGAAEIGLQQLVFQLAARDGRRALVRYYLAECHFKRKRYLEATREYRRVADEHARDALAPMALLRAGEAYARLWRRPELDPTYGLSALTTLQELVRRYPDSESAGGAHDMIADLNERFAQKAFRTGRYYLRLKAYDSAIIYFKGLVRDFPQTTFASEALLKLVEAYESIGYEEDLRDMCLQLERFYPDALALATACASDSTIP
jgi:outer membrane protein assembly factor BamD